MALGERFRSFWTRSMLVAALVTLACFGAFALLVQGAPQPVGEAPDSKFHFSSNWYAVLQAIISAVLSIGLISLIYEAFLRQTYGEDLARYLRLRASMVASGLRDVLPDGRFDWGTVLKDVSEVRAILRNPVAWLPAHQDELFEAARKRAVQLTIAVPDRDGPLIEEVAKGCGLSKEQLQNAIDTAVKMFTLAWDTKKANVSAGTTFRIVPYTSIPSYEVVIGGEDVVLLLGGPDSTVAPSERLAIAFEGGPGARYPTDWLIQQLAAPLDGLTSIWEKTK